MRHSFEQFTGNQVRLLKISGKCVRMDSKLIGSNIARQSRYELIHTTLVKFLKTCTLSDLTPEKEELAKEYLAFRAKTKGESTGLSSSQHQPSPRRSASFIERSA